MVKKQAAQPQKKSKQVNMAIFLLLDNRFKVNLGNFFRFIDTGRKLFAPIFGF